MDRVATLRTQDFAYQVAEVLVFGSYLSDVERLGDVDLAVRLVPKLTDHASFLKLCEERIRRATRTFRNSVDYFYWPEMEVLLYLRQRVRCLSIEPDIGHFVWNTAFRVLDVDAEYARRFAHSDIGFRQPLILDTGHRLREALKVHAVEDRDESKALQIIAQWAGAGGYDAIVIPTAAINNSEQTVPISQPVTFRLNPADPKQRH